ncbi:MAG: hypothetical protein K2M31_03440 [Muribaculaceae bacterium]|nr:hypothetical protein [Muribaculaceae bacterium]
MNQVSVTSAYMWALIIMAVFFVIAVVIANMVVYKPRDPGTTTRRLWFWILCIASAAVGFGINMGIASGVGVPTIKSSYELHSAIAAGVALAVYIVAGFCVSKIFSKSKVGTWF